MVRQGPMDVIGTTQTPSGRLYAYLVMPHTTHRTDGGVPSFLKNSSILFRFSAAASICPAPSSISNAPHLPSSASTTASISLPRPSR